MKIVTAVMIETNKFRARPQPGTAGHNRAQLGRTGQDSAEPGRAGQGWAESSRHLGKAKSWHSETLHFPLERQERNITPAKQ